MTARLSDLERTYARVGDGITTRGRWYSEAAVERILTARLVEAEQRERERWVTAVEALADEYEVLGDYTDDPESTPDQRARAAAGVIAAEHLRALVAQQRDGGGSE